MSLGPSVGSQAEALKDRLFRLTHDLHDGLRKSLSVDEVHLLMDNGEFDLLSKHLDKLDLGERSEEERKASLGFITLNLFRYQPWGEGVTSAEVAIKHRKFLADGEDEKFSEKTFRDALSFGHLSTILENLNSFEAPQAKDEFVAFLLDFIETDLIKNSIYEIQKRIDLSVIQKTFVLNRTERLLLEQVISDAEQKRKAKQKRGN